MIDLSHLTEEEQEMILAVLKRDSELKKSEEERIKQLQKEALEEDRRRYMTGEWFYEVKSQRHQDRIHGSDIIMASMKQQKPTVDDYLTKSWGERSRSFNIKNSDGISGDPKERVNTLQAQPERLNIGMRSPSKPRHNPFNSIPMELDFEETGSQFTLEPSGITRSSDRGFDSQVKPQELSHTEDNTEVSNIVGNKPSRQKPVPKKRTKLLKLQSSLSDSASSVSSQSVSTQSISTQSTSTQSVSTTEGSGVRSPAPRSILKYSSSCSSNESTLKSHLPQPVVTLSYIRKNSNEENDPEEYRHISKRNQEEPNGITQNKEPPKYPTPLKFPRSRLPVRAQSQLINPPQGIQEKTEIQTRLSLSSIPREDDDNQVEDGLKQKRKTDCPPHSLSMEPEGHKISKEITETLCLPHENARTAMTTNSEKPLDGITAPQHTQQRLETAENPITIEPKVEMTREEEQLSTAADQQFPGALNITEASKKANSLANADCETWNSPFAFNIKRKADNPNQESNPAVVTDSHIPNPTDEQGDSITKVLEWFSRSSDSSDKLDVESNQDMEEDIKIDDIDLEDEASENIKTRDNVYLIIPRKSEDKSSEVNSIFLQETDWGIERSVDEPPRNTPKQRRRSESFSHKESFIMKPSIDFTFTQTEDKVFREVHENEKKDSFIKSDMRAEPEIKLEKTGNKVHQPKERTDVEENQRPKLANLRSFWERENIGPKILISRSKAPAKNEPLIPNDVSTKPVEDVNDQKKTEQNLRVRSPEHQKKEAVSAVEVSDLKYVKSANTIHKPQVPIVTGESNDSLLIYSNQKKHQILASSPLDKEVTSLPHLKSSSSLDSGFLLAGQNFERAEGTVSISSSDGECTSPKELKSKSQTAPRPNPVPLIKQNSQQQENMTEKIKQLKSFWEKEKWEPRTSAQNSKSSMASTAKMNKRFTKSEFDLRSIGTEFDDDFEENTSNRGRQSPNFSVYPLRKEKPTVTDVMSTSQFKNLRDFWGGSPTKQSEQSSPVLENEIQRSSGLPTKHSKTVDTFKETDLHSFIDVTSHASPKMYNNSQSDRNKALVNESPSNTKKSLLSSPAKTERAIQSPSAKRITSGQESGSKNNQSLVVSDEPTFYGVSHITQTCMKNTTPPKHAIGQKSRPQQNRSSTKGSLNGKANAMRRASSMFCVNVEVEEQTQGLHLESKKSQGPSLHQVKKATESNYTPSRKTSESSYTLPKTPPENSWQDKEGNTQRKPSRTSEDSNFQPLARSFIPPDYQHYLGITENRRMFTPPPVTEQVEDFLCTSFTTSPETSRRCKCSPVSTSTPVPGSPDLQTRRGSQGLHSAIHIGGHACFEVPKTSAADTGSHTKGNLNRENESSVQKALRRAASRPVFHKSMGDISSPGQGQNIRQTDDCMQVSSTYVQTSFTTSDPEQMKQLSKSVPSFQQKESDGGEGDSESSSRSGVPQRNNTPYTNLSSYSGSASLSSVSGSVASLYSSDYGSVEVQGSIQFSLNYVQKLREFHIFVIDCQNLAAVDVKRNRSDPYVKSYIIPDTANLGKRKTAVKKKTLNPTYNEILRYRVRTEYLKSQVLNLSVWHNDTFGRNSFLGETELDLSSWDFNDTERKVLPLKPRNLFSRSSTSLQPSDLRGQMRLAIRFLPQISYSKGIPGTGEVHIWVKDCKNLPPIRSPSIDPYVKCFVLPDTSKKSRQKTRVLKKTTSPIFNHTMVYDGFRAEDLKEACVELTVWDRDRLANHLLGGLRLGMGTGKSYGVQVSWMDSTAEEVDLWRRMMESPSEWIEGLLPLRTITTDNNT